MNSPMTDEKIRQLQFTAPLMLAGLKYLRVGLINMEPTKENRAMLGVVTWIINKAEEIQ